MRIIRFELNGNSFYGELHNEVVNVFSDAPWLGGEITDKKFDINSVNILAPCKPNKIIATAINYKGSTGSSSDLNEPLVFIKPATSVIGPNDKIKCPFVDVKVWGECELAIVIGKKLFNASNDEAIDAVFGYTIANDVSAENINGWDHHLARSKCADTFCVLGPWIDTKFSPINKEILGYHNNILLRKGNLSERILFEPNLIVWLSKWITLEPGDVIITGAPNRVQDRLFLENNDTYTCKIEGLGQLRNEFIQIY
jgi:2-keto-4-pentenoate hydratase/2-oxohepta-3-ene-1,7-dioic acid hydratase in catechol pathway